MSDDEAPSNNPFIRFKRHVDSRIATGISVLTGGSRRTATATPSSNSPEHSLPNASMDSGAPNPPGQPSWVHSWKLGRTQPPYDNAAVMASRRYWNDWAQLSPYSPYNLRHLAPPVPAGVSPGDENLFDFEDAFEDLLAATQGQALMDLRKQADYKRRIQKTFHYGEPPMLWVNRLLHRGLLPKPLPPRNMEEMNPDMMISEVQMRLTGQESELLKTIEAQQKALRDMPKQTQEHLEKLHKELGIDANFNPFSPFNLATMQREVERLAMELAKEIGVFDFDPAKMHKQVEEVIKKIDSAELRHQADEMAKQAEKVLRLLDFEKLLNDAVGGVKEPSKHVPQAQNHQKSPPETEEDFFSAIFGALMEVNSSAKTSSESTTDWKKPGQHSLTGPLTRPVVSEVVEDNEYGGKTIRRNTTLPQPHTGGKNVHEETMVRILDAHGNVISCETHVVIRPLNPAEKEETRQQPAAPSYASQDAQMQAMLLGQREQQDRLQNIKKQLHAKEKNDPAASSHALQDAQMQAMLLRQKEQQDRLRNMKQQLRAKEEKARQEQENAQTEISTGTDGKSTGWSWFWR